MINYPETISITPRDHPIIAGVTVPGSKSITNRALILAALAEGDSILDGALESEDTEVMISALRHLGIPITVSDDGRTIRVSGTAGSVRRLRSLPHTI